MGMPRTLDGKAAVQASLARAWGLEEYQWLLQAVWAVDVSIDRGFQRRFNYFNRVRRNSDWQACYYKVMEREKKNLAVPVRDHGVSLQGADFAATAEKGAVLSFETVLCELYEGTGNLEASFASKLLAIIDPDRPIWDKLVLDRLGLRLTCSSSDSPDVRRTEVVEVYSQIEDWYARYMTKDDAKKNLRMFDRLMPDYTWVSPVKKIDYLIWGVR